MIAWITAPTGLRSDRSCWMPAITRRCWMKPRIAPSAASRRLPKNSVTRSRSACTSPRSRISWISRKPASSIATGRSPIRRTSFSRTRVQVRPRICRTNQMMPRRSHCSGIWMPERATGPASQAITPSRRCVRMFAMNWRMPWPIAESRLRRKRTGSAMITLKVSRARRKIATMRAPPAPIAASKMSSASFVSAARPSFLHEPLVGALERARLRELVDLLAPAGNELGDRPHYVHRSARHRRVRERVTPELHGDQRVSRDLATEIGERLHEPLFEPGDRLRHEPGGDIADARERRREDRLRPPPDVGRAEDVAPSERVGEAREGVANRGEVEAERLALLADPLAQPPHHAVALQHLEQDFAAGDEADEAAQQVDRVALDHTQVDGVAPDDQREQREARHVGGELGEAVEHVVEAEALHARRAGVLLQRVGELVRNEFPAFFRFGLEAALAEVDVLANGEGAGVQLAVELRRLRAGMDAHRAEVGAKARLHERTHVGRQRLARTRRRIPLYSRYRARRQRHADDVPRRRFGFALRRIARAGGLRCGLHMRRRGWADSRAARDGLVDRDSHGYPLGRPTFLEQLAADAVLEVLEQDALVAARQCRE